MNIKPVKVNKANIFIGSNSNYKRVLLLFFRKDGGINVTVPKSKYASGVVGTAILKDKNLSLKPLGKRVSSMVKFAYPSDGKVHFSQDGKIISEFKRSKCLSLENSIDHILTLYSQGFDNFQTLSLKKPSSIDSFNFYFECDSTDWPKSFRMIIRWYKKGRESIFPTKIYGKFTFEEKNSMTPKLPMYSIAMTPGSGIFEDKFTLILSFIPSPKIWNNTRENHIFLTGGFDYSKSASEEIEMLAASYPATNKELESIDYL
jgi:hypothetical protein